MKLRCDNLHHILKLQIMASKILKKINRGHNCFFFFAKSMNYMGCACLKCAVSAPIGNCVWVWSVITYKKIKGISTATLVRDILHISW